MKGNPSLLSSVESPASRLLKRPKGQSSDDTGGEMWTDQGAVNTDMSDEGWQVSVPRKAPNMVII